MPNQLISRRCAGVALEPTQRQLHRYRPHDHEQRDDQRDGLPREERAVQTSRAPCRPSHDATSAMRSSSIVKPSTDSAIYACALLRIDGGRFDVFGIDRADRLARRLAAARAMFDAAHRDAGGEHGEKRHRCAASCAAPYDSSISPSAKKPSSPSACAWRVRSHATESRRWPSRAAADRERAGHAPQMLPASVQVQQSPASGGGRRRTARGRAARTAARCRRSGRLRRTARSAAGRGRRGLSHLHVVGEHRIGRRKDRREQQRRPPVRDRSTYTPTSVSSGMVSTIATKPSRSGTVQSLSSTPRRADAGRSRTARRAARLR